MKDISNSLFFEIDINSSGLNKFPFLNINKDEKESLLFLEALTKKSTDHAKKYISKNYVDLIDYNELRTFFESNVNFKIIKKMNFENSPKNCKTNSFLFIGNDKKKGEIVNIHMVFEPDKYSFWKIYAFDQESAF